MTVRLDGCRDDGWTVWVDGRSVGRVMAAWSRAVGSGYRAFYPSGRTADYRTRRDAVRALIADTP